MVDSETLYEFIGARISCVRRSQFISQEKLADALKLSRASVSNIEAGRQKIAVHMLLVAAEYLGAPLASLLPSESAQRPADGELRLSSAKRLGEGEREDVLRVLRRVGNRAS